MTQEALVSIVRPYRTTGSEIIDIDGESIVFDADFNEQPTHAGELTDHPVEEGVDISDHFQRMPDELSMTAYVTNSPLQGTVVRNRDYQAYLRLLEILDAGEPVTIIGRLRPYNNMVLTSMVPTFEPDDSQAISFDLTFREVVVVRTEQVPIPAGILSPQRRRGGKSKTNKGKQAAEEVGSLAQAQAGNGAESANKAEQQGGSTLHGLFS